MSDEDKDFKKAVDFREQAQNDERQSRIGAIEEAHFNADEYGHWEDYATKRFEGKPRYQIDLIKPIIDSIAGKIEQKEIGGQVIPVGSDATEEIATTYEKMIRTISNMSNAVDIYSDAARNIVDHAYDAWMITHDWADAPAFDQDLLIEKIPDALNRVWLLGISSATKPGDIKHGFVDTDLTVDEYKELFSDGTQTSLSDFGYDYRVSQCSTESKDSITVSDYYYIKEVKTLLHLLSDNRVITDKEYQEVQNSLAQRGIRSVRQKERKLPTCYMRKLDGGGWLTKEAKTAFSYIPVVQVMANFQILNKRPYYRGETRKLMDAQRIYDYGTSKDINDGALGRKDKINMTPEQADGHEVQNSRLNTQDDPVFLSNHVDGHVPPHIISGSQMDAGLQNTLNRTQIDMKEISMSHPSQQGQGLAGHSGKAYEILNESSDTASFKYIKQLEKAVSWTYTIIIDAIPRVYDEKNRQIRLTNEDNTTAFKAINEEVKGDDGGVETINDLSQGNYMFKVNTGPAFSSRRAEGVAAIKEWAALDPSIIEEGKDIIYKSLDAPGVKDIASRIRKRMIAEGRIPEDQLTDDEKEKITQEIQAAKENQQPDPMSDATVQAILAEVKNIGSQIQERQVDMQVKLDEQERKTAETMGKLQQSQQKLDSDIDNKDADTLVKLREASGADAIINGNVAEAYNDKAEDLTER
jgi:hypothetical protein